MLASYTAGPYSQSVLLVCGRKVNSFLYNAYQYLNILWLIFPVLYYGHIEIYSVHVIMLFWYRVKTSQGCLDLKFSMPD